MHREEGRRWTRANCSRACWTWPCWRCCATRTATATTCAPAAAAGLDEVADASVYGTLRRLFAAGALTSYVQPSEEGPHRKYYGLNKTGRDLLAQSTKTWNHFADTMSDC